MSLLHATDSEQLERLRFEYNRLYWPTATAFRLGLFARDRKQVISDFGAHSKRWRELFMRAYLASSDRHALTNTMLRTSNSQGLT